MGYLEQFLPLALSVILGVLDIVIKNPQSRANYVRQMAKVYRYIGLAYAGDPTFQALVGGTPLAAPEPIQQRAAPAPVDVAPPPAPPPAAQKPPDPPAPPAAPAAPAPGDILKVSGSVTQ